MKDFSEWLDKDPIRRHNWFIFLLDIIQPEVTEQQRKEDLKSGLTNKQMAMKWGITEGAVKQYRYDNNMMRTDKVKEQQRKKDYEAGLSIEEMQSKWGISKAGVINYLAIKNWR